MLIACITKADQGVLIELTDVPEHWKKLDAGIVEFHLERCRLQEDEALVGKVIVLNGISDQALVVMRPWILSGRVEGEAIVFDPQGEPGDPASLASVSP